MRALGILTGVAMAAGAAAAQDAPIARAAETPPPPAVIGGALAAPSPPVQLASVHAQPPATSANADPTSAQIDDWLRADASPVQPLDPRFAPADLTPRPRQIHGEVGVTMSNRGYGGYATTTIPLGEASELDLGVAGAHVRTPWGRTANPRSLSVGLFLDSRDLGAWISRDKCNVPRWGVRLKDDPQVMPDGSCSRDGAEAKPYAGR